MGFRRPQSVVRLPLTGELEGLTVHIKALPAGLQLDMGERDVDGLSRIQLWRTAMSDFAAVLVSWDLEDENGVPIPATLEGLLSQDLEFGTTLAGAWLDLVNGEASLADRLANLAADPLPDDFAS